MRVLLSTLMLLVAICESASTFPANASQLTPAQMREDLFYLRDVWAKQDQSMDAEQRKAFGKIIEDAIAKAGTFRLAEFSLQVSRAVAVSRNGHSNSSLGDEFHSLPIRMAWFADGLFIVRAHPKYPQLVGARVDKLGALSAEEAFARVSPLISGNDPRIRYVSSAYLRLLEILHHIGAATSDEKVVLTIQDRAGKNRRVTLGSQSSPDPDGGESWLDLIPTGQDVPARWPQALDGLTNRPHAYQRPVDFYREWMDGSNTLYVRSNQIWGSDGNRYGFAGKLLSLLQDEIVPRRPKYVIVDLRLNDGGDFFNTVLFSQALPKLIAENGRIFVLVGRSTFSAAIVTAAMLKGYGGDKVVLVGEPMGDHEPFWAEGGRISLPNSKIVVTTATRMHDWSKGCDNLNRCYWANVVFGSKNVSLEPEVRVVPTFAQYAAGRDPVLEAALALEN